MLDIHPFASRDECAVTIAFGAVKCGECDRDHGYYVTFGFLFWGVQITWFRDQEDALI